MQRTQNMRLRSKWTTPLRMIHQQIKNKNQRSFLFSVSRHTPMFDIMKYNHIVFDNNWIKSCPHCNIKLPLYIYIYMRMTIPEIFCTKGTTKRSKHCQYPERNGRYLQSSKLFSTICYSCSGKGIVGTKIRYVHVI